MSDLHLRISNIHVHHQDTETVQSFNLSLDKVCWLILIALERPKQTNLNMLLFR